MIKKTLKYLLSFLLLMLMFVVTLYSIIVYTESGSRMAIDFAIKQVEVDVSYDSINGTLANGLSITNLKYHDKSLAISAQLVDFQTDWSIWDRHINVSNMKIKQVDLLIKESDQDDQKQTTFDGFQWPFAINIEQLKIHDLKLDTQEQTQHIQLITLQAAAEGHKISLKGLQLLANDLSLQATGSIHTKNGLTYDLKPVVEIKNDDWSAESIGLIQGDLDEIELKQSLKIDHGDLSGDFEISGRVHSLSSTPIFNITAKSQIVNVVIDQQTIELHKLMVDFLGQPNDYQLVLESTLSNELMPSAQLKFAANGSLTELVTESAQLITQEGMFEIKSRVDWHNQLKVLSTIVLTDFNPEHILVEWPGNLNGLLNIDFKLTDQKFEIVSKNNDIHGIVKNQPVSLSGDITYASDQFKTDHLNISLGQNHLIAHGTLNPELVDLKMSIDWPELAQLGPEFTGRATGKLTIKGSTDNPDFTADLVAKNLRIKGYGVSQLSLQSQGLWNTDIKTNLIADDLNLGKQVIDSIELNQMGWLDHHKVEVLAIHHQIQQQLTFEGAYNKSTNHWLGELINHKLTMPSNNSIKLVEPVKIEVSKTINIQPACWQGEEQGNLCLELTNINNEIEGNIKVDTLSLLPFQLWLPDNLELVGKAEGEVSFSWNSHNLLVKSNLAVNEGQLFINQPGDDNQQAIVISKLELLAQTLNNESKLHFEMLTTEGDFIKSNVKITQELNGSVWLDGNVSGEIINTQVFKELTAEINEISGKLIVRGEIKGAITQPQIELMLQQPSGYVRLSRLGTVIEKSSIKLISKKNTQADYLIEVSGQNLISLNKGKFLASGTLSKEKNNWTYKGRITGENFMIFNMPELKLNISPKLDINVNKEALKLTGDIIVDSGKVMVKQLPPNTVSNSNDLVIHTEKSASTSDLYPLILDINTQIKDRLKLDVIGLDAFLLGAIQIQQQSNQTITAKGELSLEEGKYEIYGQKLDINQGELIFNGSLDNPRLDVKASRRSLDGEVLAGVQLGGTVSNLQSQLFSEPSLSDIEILSYIMTGNGINNAGSINAEQLKQTAILLGLNQGAPVFREIQNTFGIDVLTIKEASKTADTVIEAGKKINDKLYVSYNHGIFNRLGFWVLKYKLNKFLNLQTTQGEDQSIELVYTRKSRNKLDNE